MTRQFVAARMSRFPAALSTIIVLIAVLVVVPAQPAAAVGPDTDGDGVDDDVDIDDDNDGIVDLVETTESFTWASWDPILGTTATGTIGAIGFTYTSSRPIVTTSFMFSHSSFPSQYNVPNSNPTIRNDLASSNTITFSSPALNPTIALSSIGNPVTPVAVSFDRDIEVLWSEAQYGGSFTVDSSTQITGAEGFAVIKIPGEHSSFSFDYLADEVYVNFAFGADPRTTTDSDSDSKPDHLDLDVDNDGITDNVEAQTTAGYIAPSGTDSDGNGLDDAYESTPGAGEGLTPVDTDGTGEPDYRDTDSDDDGSDDITERGDGQPTSISSTTDTDGDGLYDIFEGGTPNDGFDVNDENRDATTINLDGDYLLAADGSNATPTSVDLLFRDTIVDTDADNDGVADGIEFVTGASSPADTDGTGGADYVDTDSDGDAIADADEYGVDVSAVDFGADADNDGVPDDIDADATTGTDGDANGVLDAYDPVDADSDGTPDYRDTDSDNDTVSDSAEGGGDTDSDGTPDYRDTDSDDDGNDDDSDPNRTIAVAVDDSASVAQGTTVSFDVADNDDFVAGPTLDLTITGGTAAGSAVPDGTTGRIAYTAPPAESGAATLTYQACHNAVAPPVCDTATVTLTVIANTDDTDGDGTPDVDEMGADPNSPSDTDGDGTPDHLDTDSDNDGTPDTSDPNRSVVTAGNDTASVERGQSTTVDVLANDDIAPGSSVTITRTGGTAAGAVVFDPVTGMASYTPTDSEEGDVTISYQACFTGATPPGCATGWLTITVNSSPVADDSDEPAMEEPSHCGYDLTGFGTDANRQAIGRLYLMLYRRAPGTAELDYWSGLLAEGVSLEEILLWMMSGPEFEQRYGSLDDHGFTAALYANILCRTGETTGIDYWTGTLGDGRVDRHAMVYLFNHSIEYRSRYF